MSTNTRNWFEQKIKEKLIRLVDKHLHIAICYDSCEQWKNGILKIAEEIKRQTTVSKHIHRQLFQES